MTSAEALEMAVLVEKHDERMRGEGAARVLEQIADAFSSVPDWMEMDLSEFAKICREQSADYRTGTKKI